MNPNDQTDRLDQAALLIERLVDDADFRASFRRQPAEGARAYGLPDVAAELEHAERPLQTMDGRESRSSLAGALIAAAAEGVALADLVHHTGPRLSGDGARAVARAATRAGLPVVAARPADAVEPVVGAPAAGAPVADLPATPAPAGVHALADRSTGQGRGGHDAAEAAEGAAAAADVAGSLAYPGDHASRPAIAAWMAACARRAGLPPELPVMAAIQESGLRNIDHGDRDSVGFFQMRRSIWDTGQFRGYLQHPELQIKWFLQQATAVRRAHPGVYQGPGDYGRWIADVERPAAENRGLYQPHLAAARDLLAAENALRHQAPSGATAADPAPVLPARPDPSPPAAPPQAAVPASAGPPSAPPAAVAAAPAPAPAAPTSAPASAAPPATGAPTPTTDGSAPPAAAPAPAAYVPQAASPAVAPPVAPGASAAAVPPPIPPAGSTPPVSPSAAPPVTPAPVAAAATATPAPPATAAPAAVPTPATPPAPTSPAPPTPTPAIHDTRGITPVRHHPSAASAADASTPPSGGNAAGHRIVALARAEIGQAETSTNDSPRIAVYRSATVGGTTPGPWCAYFVSWLAKSAGAPLGDHGQGFAGVDALWAWAQHAGRAVPAGPGATAHPGDLIVFHEHIGIVEQVRPDGRIQTIEGNTSDHVGRRLHPPGDAIGFVRMP